MGKGKGGGGGGAGQEVSFITQKTWITKIFIHYNDSTRHNILP